MLTSLYAMLENDQVTFCCLLQHNVSCGRGQNHQAYKQGITWWNIGSLFRTKKKKCGEKREHWFSQVYNNEWFKATKLHCSDIHTVIKFYSSGLPVTGKVENGGPVREYCKCAQPKRKKHNTVKERILFWYHLDHTYNRSFEEMTNWHLKGIKLSEADSVKKGRLNFLEKEVE